MSDKNIHAGHRQRLLETVNRTGFEGLSDIQIMEYILTYVIPRKDTNEIAHRLLKRYGTISKVLEANFLDVADIEGMGLTSSKRLCLLSDFFKIYAKDKIKKGQNLKDYNDVYEYFWNMLAFTKTEEMHVVATDAKGDVITTLCVCRGNIKNIGIDLTTITNFAIQNRAVGIFLTHSHPNGCCWPSKADIDSTARIECLLKTLDVKLIDHIIVGNDGEYSYKLKRMIKKDMDI